MAEIIKLVAQDGSLIDSVSTEYEDSFSLESFGDLIKMHAKTEPIGTKACIIARVQTFDPKQPGKVISFDAGILFLL